MANENAPSYRLHRIEYALLFRPGSCGNLCILGRLIHVFTTQVVHRSSPELDHACWPSLSFHSYPNDRSTRRLSPMLAVRLVRINIRQTIRVAGLTFKFSLDRKSVV